VLLSVDHALLTQIDARARERGLSRSAYLAELARRDLARAASSAAAALQQLDGLFSRNPTSDVTKAIRSGRDAR